MESFIDFFGERSWLFALFVFAVLCLRYVVISALPYFLVWRVFSGKLAARRIQTEKQRPIRIKSEIAWSLASFAVFAVDAGLIHYLYIHGHTQLVTSWHALPLWGHAVGMLVLFVVHDTYFYWLHRTLHHRLIFKHIHLVHHQSSNPTPFTAFSFHPVEAFLEMVFLIPLIIWMPLYTGTLIAFLFVSHLFNVVGHMGYEFFPAKTWNAWWGSWITTSTHHNLHHQNVNSNYGLYYRMWDRACGTLNPKTEAEFMRAASVYNQEEESA